MILIKKLFLFLAFSLSIFLFFPQKASAHATPISYSPEASSLIDSVPEKIIITFSERIESGASSIIVYGPDGKSVELGSATVNPQDSRIYSIDIKDAGEGTYTASWQVVSSDDGHFTKGAFIFSVGKETPLTTSSTQFQIEHSSTIPEGMLIFLELLGQAIIVGIIGLFSLVLKPTKGLNYSSFSKVSKMAIFISIFLIITGTLGYLLLKTLELETLRQINFTQSLTSFISTTTGQFTLYRLILAVVFTFIFFFFRNKIFNTPKITKVEVVLFIIVLLMMAARSRVSHAAASSFLPELSVFINFIHLLFKDLWVGTVIASSVILIPLLKNTKDIKSKTFAFLKLTKVLILVFALTGLTGAYIIWLHLKSFDNILTTNWGIVFAILSFSAVVLFILRIVNSLVILKPFNKFFKIVKLTFPLEALVGVFLLLITAFIIITTPPLEKENAFKKLLYAQDSEIIFSEHPFDNNYFLITFERDASVQNVVLTFTNNDESIGPILVDTEKRFEGGYAFHKNNLSPEGTWKIEIVGQRLSGYDLHTSLTIAYPSDLEAARQDKNDFFFTIFILINAIGIICISAISYKAIEILAKKSPISELRMSNFTKVSILTIFLMFLLFLVSIWVSYIYLLKSDFQKKCEANWHVWNQSVPMKSGGATSSIAVAGCSLGRSAGQFHFGDEREYEYFTRPAFNSQAELDINEPIEVGTPTTLSFTIKDYEGNPEKDLIIDHERLIHVIVISSDLKTFAHIHPEDLGDITEEMRQSSNYLVEYTFPKPGRYIVAVDFSVRSYPSSSTFIVNVEGEGEIQEEPEISFERTKTFGDYKVELKTPDRIVAREISPFSYTISKNGIPVEDLSTYLGSPMHLAIVDSNLRDFIHGHGELPKSPIERFFVNRRQIEARAHVHKIIPDAFGPNLEAYLIFPRSGIYKVFGEIMHGGKIILTDFTIEVE